jgi:hypothetical protein
VPVDNESLLRASIEVGLESKGGPTISD